ncbi:MAG TPA: glyoxylate/hydroxypyruvate reductase A [Paenirhodobacter sp.]
MTSLPGKALLIAVKGDTPELYRQRFLAEIPWLTVHLEGETYDPATIAHVVCWRPTPGLLASLPRLEAIFSMAAGVDHILADPHVPEAVPIVRLVHDGIGEQLRDYAIHSVLHYYRRMDVCAELQASRAWDFLRIRPKSSFRPALMGLGEAGRTMAGGLGALGFPVMGWSRSARSIEGVTCFSGADGLDAMLAETSVLISILPSTADTVGILNAGLFARLPRGAYLVNLGRGSHLVEGDLVAALDNGQLAGATLDVFAVEPLPADSPLWHHPLIRVTPHLGSDNDADIVVESVAANLRRIAEGLPPAPIFDRLRGY